MIGCGRVTDRPMEAVAQPNTNRAVGSGHAPTAPHRLAALLARLGTCSRLAQNFWLGPAGVKDIPGPSLHRHHLADDGRLGQGLRGCGLRHRQLAAPKERGGKSADRESRDNERSKETRTHTGSSVGAGGWHGIATSMPMQTQLDGTASVPSFTACVRAMPATTLQPFGSKGVFPPTRSRSYAMKRLGLLAIPLLCLSTPASSADLY